MAGKAEQKCVHIFGNEGRSEMRNYRSFAVKAEGKCGGGTSRIWQSSDLWQSRLSENAEAKLQIFGSRGRDEMRKRNFTSLEVLAEQVRKAELQIFASQGRAEVWKRNSTFSAVNVERRCGVELQNFGSKDRAEAELQSLAVKAERKCGSGTSGLCQ